MASSPPVKGNGGSTPGGAVPPGAGGAPETPPPAPTKWPRWRVLMLIGAFILLGAAILETFEDVPRALKVGLFFVGYVFLAYGFFTAMNARKGGGTTPRDRG